MRRPVRYHDNSQRVGSGVDVLKPHKQHTGGLGCKGIFAYSLLGGIEALMVPERGLVYCLRSSGLR